MVGFFPLYIFEIPRYSCLALKGRKTSLRALEYSITTSSSVVICYETVVTLQSDELVLVLGSTQQWRGRPQLGGVPATIGMKGRAKLGGIFQWRCSSLGPGKVSGAILLREVCPG